MNNQRGGIISKLFIIPAGVALMVGFFFLGYYVGRYQSKPAAKGEPLPPLPEVVSKNLPKPEDFTFYKTLTEKENKTVSIDLLPKKGSGEGNGTSDRNTTRRREKEKPSAVKPEKKAAQHKAVAPPAHDRKTKAKKEAPPSAASADKSRYSVQVSSYQDRKDAEEEVRRMKQSGFAAFVVSSDIPGMGTWFRVRLGSFTNKGAAERLQNQVRAKMGVSPIVVLE